MVTPYICGIDEYDFCEDRPFDNVKKGDRGLYVRCVCGKLWSQHTVKGFKKCKRYEPKIKKI